MTASIPINRNLALASNGYLIAAKSIAFNDAGAATLASDQSFHVQAITSTVPRGRNAGTLDYLTS